MRYLGFILSTAVLTGCSAAGLGSFPTSNCAPQCAPYAAPSNVALTYAQPSYAQPSYAQPSYAQPVNTQYWQAHHNQAGNYPAGYATSPAPHSYGTHAQAPYIPQLRGPSNPYAARGYKYGTLGGILYDFDSDKFGIQGRIGYQSAGLWGAELEGSIGLGSETKELTPDAASIVATTTPNPTPGTLTTEYTNSIAAFGLARLPISDRFSIHSRVGLHSTRFEAELDDGTQVLSQNETSIDLAYGLGMEYALTPKNDIRLDYTVYEADFGGNADSLSLAYKHKF